MNEKTENQNIVRYDSPRRVEVIESRPVNVGTEEKPKTEWQNVNHGKGYCFGGDMEKNLWYVEMDSRKGHVCGFQSLTFIEE